jgi:hypothetical protein
VVAHLKASVIILPEGKMLPSAPILHGQVLLLLLAVRVFAMCIPALTAK